MGGASAGGGLPCARAVPAASAAATISHLRTRVHMTPSKRARAPAARASKVGSRQRGGKGQRLSVKGRAAVRAPDRA
jgi:hypothetical protein